MSKGDVDRSLPNIDNHHRYTFVELSLTMTQAKEVVDHIARLILALMPSSFEFRMAMKLSCEVT